MKIRALLKIIAVAALTLGALGGGLYLFLLLSPSTPSGPMVVLPDNTLGWRFPIAKFPLTGSNPNLIAYSDIRDPGGIPQGLPVRLKIPVIGVDSAIEDALITPDGRMDVPAGSVNVAWFALGPHPGQVGSAVIGGHYGIQNGVPFVFYKLDKVKIGDKIYIEDDKGETLSFIVRKISSFDRNADATTVFTSNDGLSHLNLITCEGIWNKVNDTYPQRLVVFTDAVSSAGAAAEVKTAVKAVVKVAATFPRTLRVGSRGADVAALQTILVQKGFLKMPAGVAKGTFGSLTKLALAKYQASVGLPKNGVFSSTTMSKLIAEQSTIAAKPTLPSTAIAPVESTSTPVVSASPAAIQTLQQTPPSFGQLLLQFAASLFSTPLHGFITSVALLLILFIAYKIIRH